MRKHDSRLLKINIARQDFGPDVPAATQTARLLDLAPLLLVRHRAGLLERTQKVDKESGSGLTVEEMTITFTRDRGKWAVNVGTKIWDENMRASKPGGEKGEFEL